MLRGVRHSVCSILVSVRYDISWYRIVYVCRLYYIHDEQTKWLFCITI